MLRIAFSYLTASIRKLLLLAVALLPLTLTLAIDLAMAVDAPNSQTPANTSPQNANNVARGLPEFESSLTSAGKAALSLRLEQIESQLRRLTGAVEEATYLITQLKNDLAALQRQQSITQQSVAQQSAQQQEAAQQPNSAPANTLPVTTTKPAAPQSAQQQPAAQQEAVTPQSAQQQEAVALQPVAQPPNSAPANTLPVTTTKPVVQEPAVQQPAVTKAQDFANTPPQQLYQEAFGLIRQAKYQQSREYFQAFLEKFPKHALASNALYWLGETYYIQREYREAAEAFLKSYTTSATARKAPDSLLKLGMTLKALGENKAACDAYNELGKKFPKAPANILRRLTLEQQKAQC